MRGWMKKKRKSGRIWNGGYVWSMPLRSPSSIVSSKFLKITEKSCKGCKSLRCFNSCVQLSVQVSQNMYLAEFFGDGAMKSLMKIWRRRCRNGKHCCVCVPAVDSVDKFMQILDRRKVELQSFGAASVESLFAVHAMKGDAELRCCYDFMQRTFPSLAEETKEMVRNALGQLLPAAATVPLKKSHEAKLHSRETVLGDNLPRPRLPKSLRQLYGNSADAESRTMVFFHRVNEVDTFFERAWISRLLVLSRRMVWHQADESTVAGEVWNANFPKNKFCANAEKRLAWARETDLWYVLKRSQKASARWLAEATISIDCRELCRSWRHVARNGCFDISW